MRKKSELIDAIAGNTGLTKTDVQAVLDALPEVATQALQKQESCILPGFGTLKVTHRAARKGRNPQTGKEMDIAASKSVSLKAAKQLKEAIA